MTYSKTLENFLEETSRLHRHLCPRQVLGVRMGMLAAKLFSIKLPQDDKPACRMIRLSAASRPTERKAGSAGKRLLTIVETDCCTADGISVATNCTVGHRTLRVVDYGKVAATFVDTETGRAFRITPHNVARQRAHEFAPEQTSKWETQLIGYQRMPDELLFKVREVEFTFSLKKIISRAGKKAICSSCGEEIINEREVVRKTKIVCRACDGNAYYKELPLKNIAESESCLIL